MKQLLIPALAAAMAFAHADTPAQALFDYVATLGSLYGIWSVISGGDNGPDDDDEED